MAGRSDELRTDGGVKVEVSLVVDAGECVDACDASVFGENQIDFVGVADAGIGGGLGECAGLGGPGVLDVDKGCGAGQGEGAAGIGGNDYAVDGDTAGFDGDGGAGGVEDAAKGETAAGADELFVVVGLGA